MARDLVILEELVSRSPLSHCTAHGGAPEGQCLGHCWYVPAVSLYALFLPFTSFVSLFVLSPEISCSISF